jgi:hypothetical protein
MTTQLSWRRPDGSVIWCSHSHDFGRQLPVQCARVIGHDGAHVNGTYSWPQESLDTTSRKD